MRPYLAIIKDSFRAAMASRVLYVLLLLIALFLLILAPLHMRESLEWKLQEHQNIRPEQAASRLVQKHDQPNQQPIARIWELLPEKLKKRLKSLDAKGSADDDSGEIDSEASEEIGDKAMAQVFTYRRLIESLNEIIENRDFYREADWQGRVLPAEATDLIESGVNSLPEIRCKRLNRLLISQALAPAVQRGSTAIEFWYAVWNIPFLTQSSSPQQFAQSLTSQLPYYFDKFVLSIGLFIAILVTANMIPETFEPGSLNLLLSKPVSRWGLYIAKFLGGCAFIFLCASFLFLGVWLWLGLGLKVWDRAILISIPLYVLVFAIYFSVSALVGLIWRSAIVAVILTLLFWALCWSAGSIYGLFNTKMGNSELVELLEVDDELLVVDSLLQVNTWDNSQWQPKLEAEFNQQAQMQNGFNSFIIPMRYQPKSLGVPGVVDRISPVYVPELSRVFAVQYAAGSLASDSKLFSAKTDNLKFNFVGEVPRGAVRMMVSTGGLIVATADGEFHRLNSSRFVGESQDNASESENISRNNEDQNNAVQPTLFERVGPNLRMGIRSREMVAMNSLTDQIAIYGRGELAVFEPSANGNYTRKVSLELDVAFDKGMSCSIDFKGSTIVLVFGNGQIISVDAESMQERNEYLAETRSAIASIVGSEDGRFFVARYRNGALWLLDMQSPEEMKRIDAVGNGDVCAVGFSGDQRLLVGYNTDRAVIFDLEKSEVIDRFAPTGTWIENLFRYGISPVYTAFPKPGEFYKVVSHLSSSGDTADNKNLDLRRQLFELSNPWLPLRSGLIFMGIMIFLACWIFHFKDF